MKWNEPAPVVTIRPIDGRFVIFDSKGARVESKATKADAIKTAKRRFPTSTIEG